jgi:hypothetical protein
MNQKKYIFFYFVFSFILYLTVNYFWIFIPL